MIKKINFENKSNLKLKILFGIILFLIIEIINYWFFTNYKLQSPILIKFQSPLVPIKKQSSNAPKIRDNTTSLSSEVVKKTPQKTAKNKQINVYQTISNNKTEVYVAPFKKYLTSDASILREKILIYLKEKLQDENEIVAVDNIFKKESGYRPDAINEIGAGGLCQAYPHTKMNCQLTYEDWQCQVDWCLNYIKNRYSKPTEAWSFHLVNNWF